MEPTQAVLRLSVGALIGAAVGFQRALDHKDAGLRTFGLVGLAGALAAVIAPDYPDALSRIAQGLLTGVGFLGAGMILRPVAGKRVHGLTTAAAIWLTALLGFAAGAGLWIEALTATLLALLLLVLGDRLDRRLANRTNKPGGEDGDTESR